MYKTRMADQEQGLRRELSAGQIAMVAVGGSIGTGLLLGSGAAMHIAGPAVIISYVLAAVVSFMVSMALAEMSAAHPAAGSFGVYAEHYLNPWAGFIARYGYWFSVVSAIGSELVAAGGYMKIWFPHVPVVFWMAAFAIFLLVINFFSVGHYGTFEYWFALIKVTTIFAFIISGSVLLFGGKVPPQYLGSGGFAANGWAASLRAVSFGLYSFLGIEMVAVSSGEARSRAELARAARVAFTTLAIVYLGAMAVLVGVMPWKSAGVSQSPFVAVFELAGLPAAGTIMNLVVLSAALSAANASLYVTSRMLFSLARAGYAPARLGLLNRQGVPTGSLLASALGIVVAMVLAINVPEKAYLYIIGAALTGGMLAWLVSLLAHIRFRRALSPAQLAELGIRSPLGPFGSIGAFIAIIAAILLTWRVPASRVTALSAGPYILILSIAYFLVRRNQRRKALRQIPKAFAGR
jgi:L-asparagine transporter-like permease